MMSILNSLPSQRSAIAAGVALLLSSLQVQAQAADDTVKADETSNLGKVTVRTRNRLEPLKDIPVSVSVVTGTELERLNAIRLGDITQRASNVSWNLGNSRTSSLSIRGIGKQAQTDAMDPSVGIVVDGVAYAYNPLASFDFTDLAAVEVARGPQGTQGGKNTNMGLITITTRRPTFTPEADYSLALGIGRTVIGKAAVGGPLIDNLLAWRGTFAVERGDGPIKNAYNTDFSYPNKDNISGRVQFLLTPKENLEALFKVEYQPRRSEFYNGWLTYRPTPTTYANGAPNNLATDASTRLGRRWFTQESNYSYLADYLGTSPNLDNQQPLVTASTGASAQVNWTLGNQTLTSITAYKDYRFQARNDEGTPFDISKNGGGHVFFNQASQEFRLSSQGNRVVDYSTGLYFVRTSNDYDSGSGYGADSGAWFANAGQYSLLDADGAGRYLLSNSLNRLNLKPLQKIRNSSGAFYGQAEWHLLDPLTLTTGIRFTREDRENTVSKLIYDNGFAPELNPAAVNGVVLGGFDSNSAGVLAATNTVDQLAVADATAQKYFGVASYGALTTNQRAQIGAAKAIRQSQLGVLWNPIQGPRYKKTQPAYVFSPGYKINDQVTAYASLRYGEKSGISLVVNGVPFLAEPEKSTAYELGVKTALLDHKLTLNIDVFENDIKNYQQLVQVFDAYTTALRNDGTTYFTATTGNAAKVRVRGVEVDGVYAPLPSLSLRLSAAFNDAVYRDFQNSGQPLENANLTTPYRNVSGQHVPGAAKFSSNIGVDYRVPVLSNKELHSSLNYAYSSRYNSDPLLSSYSWVPAYGVADLSIGLGRTDGKLDISLLAKNLLNDDTSQVVLWNSYVPAVPRWYGVQFSAKL
jgi:outer membrane receptor protein involved in Fe transport